MDTAVIASLVVACVSVLLVACSGVMRTAMILWFCRYLIRHTADPLGAVQALPPLVQALNAHLDTATTPESAEEPASSPAGVTLRSVVVSLLGRLL